MLGRSRAVFAMVLAAAALIGAQAPATSQSQATGGGGLSRLSAIVETLRLNGIDPFVRSPAAGGAEPFAIALVPVDSDAAQAAAALWNLRRLEPTEGGERKETMILPRQRPVKEEEVAEAPKPPKATVVTATSDAYRKYIADLTYIAKLRLDDPNNLRRAQQLLVNHSLISLARAWIAQCSEIAARSQDFVSGVDKAADKNGGAENLKSTISKQPFMVLDFPGWQKASLAISQDLAKDVALMASLAWRFSEVAYGRPGGEARYAQEANKGNLTAAAPAGGPTASAVSSSTQLSARAKPIMTQMLALGAHLHLSNQGTVSLDPAQSALATNKDNDQCLRWAQLNLDQCLAAARDNQERAYCLGKTGIEERSNCWSWMVSPSS